VIGSPNTPIARTVESFDVRTDTVRSTEAPIGNVIADAMRQALSAEVALITGGQIRSDAQFGKGAILTRSDFLAITPFSNRLVLLHVSGEDIRLALEHGLKNLGGGPFPQVSVLRFSYDSSREPGDRVREIWVGGRLLDVTRSYSVAVTDYTTAGGDGYSMFRRGTATGTKDDGTVLADAVLDYLRPTATISSQPEGRIIRLSKCTTTSRIHAASESGNPGGGGCRTNRCTWVGSREAMNRARSWRFLYDVTMLTRRRCSVSLREVVPALYEDSRVARSSPSDAAQQACEA
jgi:2',3'-cyclic-nucleotide 2'-phosphodiesterase (5'-nucleotidase family)